QYAELFKAWRELKSDDVLVNCPLQFNLNFESYRDVYSSMSKIVLVQQFPHTIRAPPNLLKQFECQTNGCFAASILSNQQCRRLASDRQLEIFQASEVVDVKTADHKRMIHDCVCIRTVFY